MTSHIFAQNASWTPWSRLCLQAGFNYVVSETKTPTSDYTQAVLNSQNNYWTVTFDSSVVVDDKTDLNLGFVYYQADNYNNNSSVGLPLGAGAEEHSVTATLTRRITRNLRFNLKYAYSHYNDWASGGKNNYDAQMVYSSLQYRF
jgi:predicted porin